MPPKKKTDAAAPATATATATAKTTRKAAPRKAAAAKPEPAAEAPKAASKKTAAATKKTAAAAVATKKAPAAPKKTAAAAAPKKTAAASKAKKAAEESDKENTASSQTKANLAKRKRDDVEDEDEEKTAVDEDEAQQANAPSPARSKRSASEDGDEQPAKKIKVAPKKAAASRVQLKAINKVPTQVMDIFVFGEGSSGELGLGAMKYQGKKPIDVKRPRINHNLKGIVQVACGGMHVAALTNDNRILTWGVNDQGALGRETTWSGGLRDVDDEESDDDDDDDSGLNPKESLPAEIDTSNVPEDTVWSQVVASDSATFALTNTGKVYGWGTFRSNEGILGFNRKDLIQKTAIQITELTKIVQLAAGSNHIIALDDKNKISAWGAGQQGQLARKLLERDYNGGLVPTGIGRLPLRAKAEKITCGSYHSFVQDTKGRVIGWGLNNFAELGIETEAGEDGGYVMKPEVVASLAAWKIASVTGGEHHSLACTVDGTLLTWGRIDGHQVGQPAGSFNEDNALFDDQNKPRILLKPQPVPGVDDVVSVAAGTDHSLAITGDGQVYSWGFSANYQTGQGTTEDIATPTLIDNSAIRDRKIIWAGAGGQYSILGAAVE
ncbi:regulator of chromosome condensation 1/beta-lactamase-inhibitor protein II [Podospora appendiculata]|uniref:Regulator of chromosome condensation 1/beta-lactamase-inhibitor protein II n=1 Tax=Podospora appendiculata TaxID=314037 RepID=A0AAE1C837_9PEZI|nr:regulator of chromosome condensation 1/beta-lactamase-inhibitor protein II [Podospora appendiculata]